MMGPAGSFKTAVWRILARSKDILGDKMTIVDYNPKLTFWPLLQHSHQ
jgi:hypothetical protein